MERIHALSPALAGAAAACLLAACGGNTDVVVAVRFTQPCGAGACVSTVAGSGEFGTADGGAMAAQFFMPHSLVVDAMSQLHVADFGASNATRLLAAGQVSTLAEDPIEFPQPGDRATDAAGNTFVADTFGNRILRIAPGGETTVLAGTGQMGDQDGDASSATFSLPSGLAFDAGGALFVADMGNRKIRRITFPGGAGG